MQPEAVAAELLDHVDAGDRVIGRVTRGEIHARGLRHRAVHIVVTNPSGALFVQRRSLLKDCAPGLWDSSAAGHVDAGEDYDTAAARELDEELGLAAIELSYRGQLAASAATGFEFVRYYTACTSRVPLPDPAEIMDSGWFSPTELGNWQRHQPEAFTATFRHIFSTLYPH